jgi:DNA-directed RNA polymerase subunit M/transcription elongation factor TFIIS
MNDWVITTAAISAIMLLTVGVITDMYNSLEDENTSNSFNKVCVNIRNNIDYIGTNKIESNIIIDEGEKEETTEVICPKCGKKVKAAYKIIHLPKSDDEEEEVILYRCLECGYVWREE